MADWSKQRWIKLYTHDSLTWLSWPWETRAVFLLLLRKVDADGTVRTEGLQPWDAVSILTGAPVEVVRDALEHMERTGTVRMSGDEVCVVNFERAQATRTSDAERKRRQRERKCHTASRDVTASHAESQRVTSRERDRSDRVEKRRGERGMSEKQRGFRDALVSELERAKVPRPLISQSLNSTDPIGALKQLKAKIPELAAELERESEQRRAERTRREIEASRVPDDERASPEQIGAILDRLKQKTSTSDPECGKQ